MKNGACAFTLIMVAFLSLVCIQLVSAPQQPWSYIRADGSVEGTNIIRRNGNTYTFSGNVTGPLCVEKDNIVIDGAGYTLQGGDGRGIVLTQRCNVTVKNTRITLDGGYSFQLDDASGCNIIGNELVGLETSPSLFGMEPIPSFGPISINLLHSDNNIIEDNDITHSFVGISVDVSTGNIIRGNGITDAVIGLELSNSKANVLRNNRMSDSSIGFSLHTYSDYEYDNDVDASNTVDGKPVYYWQYQSDKVVPSDAAYVVLLNCSGITIQNTSPQGIVLVSTTNSTLSKVTAAERGESVTLLRCSSVNIVDCVFRNQAIGIKLDFSSNNVITRSIIENCSTRGINFGDSHNNVISENSITGNNDAVATSQDTVSNGNIFRGNSFTDNGNALIPPGSCIISDNMFVGNDQAILCTRGSQSISGNNLTGNSQGIIFQTQNNVLRDNRFTNNSKSLIINGANFVNDVDSSNTVNGKPICYWVNRQGETVPSNAGLVILANCANITVQRLVLSDQANGILLAYTMNSTVTSNLITNNANGIFFYGSTGNRIIANNITNNGYAVYIGGATVAFLGGTASYTPSSDNLFHHNNFVNNSQTVYDAAGSQWVNSAPSANSWDNGAAGNFWSDYSGTDANDDGVGDSFRVVYADQRDRFPLMKAVEMTVPEFSTWVVLLILSIATVAAVALRNKLISSRKANRRNEK